MTRPASAHAHEAVLCTALKLISDRGIEGTSVDDIAEVSGVSKATIYKHWTNKEALCIEAISRLKCDIPTFDSDDPRSDITQLLKHLARTKRPEAFSRIWPRVMGYAASNPAFAKAFRARLTDGRRAQLTELLQRAMAKGQLNAGLDIDVATDLLLGPILYRRFMQASVPPGLAKCVVDSFWQLNGRKSEQANNEAKKRGNFLRVDGSAGVRPSIPARRRVR
jgi:AcrR family transcriptional regulator